MADPLAIRDCPKRDDHCCCFYDGDPCCRCGDDPPLEDGAEYSGIDPARIADSDERIAEWIAAQADAHTERGAA